MADRASYRIVVPYAQADDTTSSAAVRSAGSIDRSLKSNDPPIRYSESARYLAQIIHFGRSNSYPLSCGASLPFQCFGLSQGRETPFGLAIGLEAREDPTK